MPTACPRHPLHRAYDNHSMCEHCWGPLYCQRCELVHDCHKAEQTPMPLWQMVMLFFIFWILLTLQ